MKQEIKAKWVAALRSEKYQQTSGRLREKVGELDAYCCLGVLCDIVAPEDWDRTHLLGYASVFHHQFCRYEPSEVILNDCGISRESSEALACMNDRGATFETIAQYIEENF